MITKRDQDILNYLDDFKISTTKQIHRIFFNGLSYRCCARRLEQLEKYGHIKHTNSTIDISFAYYTDKKPVQIHHNLLRSEIYSHIINMYNVLEWHNEYSFQNIRSDSFAYIDDHGIPFPVFLEVHLGNSFNFDKYNILAKENDLKVIFGLMPRVVIFTDRNVSLPKNSPIKFKLVDVNTKGLDSLFK